MPESAGFNSPNTPVSPFVVIHPVAGKCNPKQVRNSLNNCFGEAGWKHSVYETTGKEHLPDIVRNALQEGFNMFVVAGGDGTVSDVAEGLVHTGIPIAIIPVGTGNVLARELWIPMNVNKACRLITSEHNMTDIDAMFVADRYYFQTLSAGFASLMIRDTKREHKRIYGLAAYLWSGLTNLVGFQPRKFEIKIDGKTHTSYANEVALMNAGTLAMRPILLGKGIRVDDGKVDICIIRGRTILDYLTLAVRIIMRLQKYDRNIEYLKAERTVSISTDVSLVVQADGEIIGTTPVDIQIVPNAVKVIVPLRTRKSIVQWAKSI